mgnify:CR=1 FL=1|tara:strand:- start:52 stop:522 length:471 start_codon:yes stop_codon:yes gene_type:complete
MKNYIDAILKSLFIITLKVFVIPLKVTESARKSILNSNNEEKKTDFVILLWIKNFYDAGIVLSYPIGVSFILYSYWATGVYPGDEPLTPSLIAMFIGVYFSPVFLGFCREIIAYFLVSVIKLEEISQNTSIRSQLKDTADSDIQSFIKKQKDRQNN